MFSRVVLGVGLMALVEAFVRWHRTRIYVVGATLIDEDGECEETSILGWFNSEKDAERAIFRAPHGCFSYRQQKSSPLWFSHAVLEVYAEGDLTDPLETRWYATEEHEGKKQVVHRVKRPVDISDFWRLTRT